MTEELLDLLDSTVDLDFNQKNMDEQQLSRQKI